MRTRRKRAPHYCPICKLIAETAYNERRDGKRRYDPYCVLCNREYKRDVIRRNRIQRILDTAEPPKLNAQTLALVSADPLWLEWLQQPPRVELVRQHELAVQLQRKYRCDYAQLSHSMRAAWCDYWEAKLGHAPYLHIWEGVA